MPTWRSHELESLIGGPADSRGLTAASLEAMVADQLPETELLEFKGREYARRPQTAQSSGAPGRDNRQEFAKDVLALANHRGGLLILGVTERDGRAAEVVPLAGNADEEQRWLRTALAQFSAPLPEVDLISIPLGADGFALAVVVPPSARAPHALLAGSAADARNPLSYPVRNGTATRWMPEHEVAERYTRRLALARSQREVLAEVALTGRDRLDVGDGAYYLYVAIAPEIPAQRRIDRATVDANYRWVRQQDVEVPGSQGAFFGQSGVRAAPGRTVLGSMRPDPVDGPYVELYASGAAFAASSVSDVQRPEHRNGQLPLWALTALCIALVELVGRWTADQAVVPGTALVEAGLVRGRLGGGTLPPTQLMSRGSFGEDVPTAGAHEISGQSPIVETVYPLMAVGGTQGAVQVASAILDGLVQWFGLSDCPYLEPDGSIVPGVWNVHEQAVREWADRHGVPTNTRG